MERYARSDYEPPFVLAIDIGSSSVRASLFDVNARQLPDIEARTGHPLHSTHDGGSEEYADHLIASVERAVDSVLSRAGNLQQDIVGVALDTLAGTVLGVDSLGCPVTPIYSYADTRSHAQAEYLKETLDVEAVYQRTGCPQHMSYLPSRLLWLNQSAPELARQVRKWVDVGTFLYARWFDDLSMPCSYTIASWMGLLDRKKMEWDEELLRTVKVSQDNLPTLSEFTDAQHGLAEPFASRWPALRDVPFYLAVGDGLSANVGSGCVGPGRIALTMGTSGAMRVLLDTPDPTVPSGLWSYHVENRALLGGSFSDGGSVFAWANDTLRLPAPPDQLESGLQALPPAGSGLTVLPFLSGERSPGWAPTATGLIEGLRVSTTPVEILQAALEGVSYRFGAVWDLLAPFVSEDVEIVASGGAITSSPYWLQLMADVLQQPVIVCNEPEATSRGTAILGLYALGLLPSLDTAATALGEIFQPNADRAIIYQRQRVQQQHTYERNFGDEVSAR